MKQEAEESIVRTRAGFAKSFETVAFYNKQTEDQAHLAAILQTLTVARGTRILDLGTGMGFLAFPLAARFREAQVLGLDIVDQTLARNRARVEAEGLGNLQFVSYDGVHFPFADGAFDLVVTRYTLHHFPCVQDTFREIARVLKRGGTFFLSDPAPNDDDEDRFVDAYMQMKPDGHVKFYTKQEWESLARAVGLALTDSFETGIRFPKKISDAPQFEAIRSRFDPRVVQGYAVEKIGDELWITERVNNLSFQKCAQ